MRSSSRASVLIVRPRYLWFEHRLGLLSLIGVLTLFSTPNTLAEDGPLARVHQGTLHGNALGGGVMSFVGIPFAAPPIGELRWRPPVPPKSWTGVRDALKFGAPCTQPAFGGKGEKAPNSSEDCLYLNVWTPDASPKSKLPVMFWIHGGAFTDGTGAHPVFNGKHLASLGVVIVTINYRMGVLGFLAHRDLVGESPDHSAGNYAFADQLAALRWVHENIGSFGGDPKKVTIFGQSAGAASVSILMTSPQSRGLFRAVIAESGTAFLGTGGGDLAAASAQGTEFGTAANAASINDLRKLSTEDVFNRWKIFAADKHARMGPIVDGWILPRFPSAVFAAHQEIHVPLLIGNNAREGFGPMKNDLMGSLRTIFGDATPRAAAIYMPSGETPSPDPILGTAANVLATDQSFRCGAVTIETWHTQQHSPVFAYQFEAPSPESPKLGAQHSAELMYLFGFPGPGHPDATPISHTVMTYWTNFAKRLDPNGQGVPHWPQFGTAASYVHLGVDGVTQDTRLRGVACDLYRDKIVPGLLSGTVN